MVSGIIIFFLNWKIEAGLIITENTAHLLTLLFAKHILTPTAEALTLHEKKPWTGPVQLFSQ